MKTKKERKGFDKEFKKEVVLFDGDRSFFWMVRGLPLRSVQCVSLYTPPCYPPGAKQVFDNRPSTVIRAFRGEHHPPLGGARNGPFRDLKLRSSQSPSILAFGMDICFIIRF